VRLLDRPLPGMLVLEAEPRADERGWFQRCFCRAELAALGVDAAVEQVNLSRSERRRTLRGLHYQAAPGAEAKIVTCLEGAVHDVVLDLRSRSPTFGRHAAVQLSPANRRILVVPAGCAHGFLTLAAGTQMLYLVTAAYDPALDRGVRWDDPAFAIPWPAAPEVISPRDAALPGFSATVA
jgi:dTDP-4-dehydrorhamnose 3,5-epimerase